MDFTQRGIESALTARLTNVVRAQDRNWATGVSFRAGLSSLNEGQHIEYEIEDNRGKTSARNLRVK
jgi:hypothetical protein